MGLARIPPFCGLSVNPYNVVEVNQWLQWYIGQLSIVTKWCHHNNRAELYMLVVRSLSSWEGQPCFGEQCRQVQISWPLMEEWSQWFQNRTFFCFICGSSRKRRACWTPRQRNCGKSWRKSWSSAAVIFKVMAGTMAVYLGRWVKSLDRNWTIQSSFQINGRINHKNRNNSWG